MQQFDLAHLVAARDASERPYLEFLRVPALGVEHRFHTIVEGLTILISFAPAEYIQATTDDGSLGGASC